MFAKAYWGRRMSRGSDTISGRVFVSMRRTFSIAVTRRRETSAHHSGKALISCRKSLSTLRKKMTVWVWYPSSPRPSQLGPVFWTLCNRRPRRSTSFRWASSTSYSRLWRTMQNAPNTRICSRRFMLHRRSSWRPRWGPCLVSPLWSSQSWTHNSHLWCPNHKFSSLSHQQNLIHAHLPDQTQWCRRRIYFRLSKLKP